MVARVLLVTGTWEDANRQDIYQGLALQFKGRLHGIELPFLPVARKDDTPLRKLVVEIIPANQLLEKIRLGDVELVIFFHPDLAEWAEILEGKCPHIPTATLTGDTNIDEGAILPGITSNILNSRERIGHYAPRESGEFSRADLERPVLPAGDGEYVTLGMLLERVKEQPEAIEEALLRLKSLDSQAWVELIRTCPPFDPHRRVTIPGRGAFAVGELYDLMDDPNSEDGKCYLAYAQARILRLLLQAWGTTPAAEVS